jgi:uncharacterized protein (TIGR00255 family)
MSAEAKEGLDAAIRSMTGFGRGHVIEGGVEVSTEVRSVNHRFLDISLRLPKAYSAIEPHIRKAVSELVFRGKLDVSIARSGNTSGLVDLTLDVGLALQYYDRLAQMKDQMRLGGDITLSDMLTLKEIIAPVERQDGAEAELPQVLASVRMALASMDAMRRAEGASIWKDIEARLLSIVDTVKRIDPLVDRVVAAAKDRLHRRVKELTGGLDLDEDRLLQEVALIADRSDVTEELARLHSHVDQFFAFGKEGSPLGRKLDFLLQEVHREVNTLGAKSASSEIAQYVVLLKTEAERIREQTQNLE